MTWSELAQADGDWLWTLPASRFKTAVPHIVPMTGAVMAELPARQRGPFIFSTSDGHRPFSGYGKALLQLHKASGTAGWALHDLRRTMRTRLAALQVPDPVAELTIGHGKRGLARTYDQWRYLAEIREALAGC